MSTRGLAPIELDLRPSVPASVVRVLAGVAGGLAVLLVGFQGWQDAVGADGLWDAFGSPQLTGASVVLGILASVWIVARTQDHVAPLLAVAVGIACLATSGGISWRTYVLAGLLLVMLRASALVGGLPWDARVEIDVLRPVLRSTGAVLLALILVGSVAAFFDGSNPPDVAMKFLGFAAVVVAAIWLLPKNWLGEKR